jgi:glucose-1-phosphate thymidylyltransferase
MMKGIILAGGSGTRLYPITKGISKQIMPIYDKPMVYYPLSILMQAGIKDILVITTPDDQSQFQRLLGDGSNLGINLQYEAQPTPGGLAQAFIIGEKFIGSDKVALILGDNIFHGEAFGHSLKQCDDPDGGIVFAYRVADPERYGVVEFDAKHNVVSIEEKPAEPKSDYAVVGLYFYDNDVIEITKGLKPSDRGELEITSVESMNDASEYVRVIEKRTGLKIGCIEEAAYRQGFINKEQLQKIAEPLKKSGYGHYLLSLTD